MSYRPEWFPKKAVLEIVMNVVGYTRGNYSTMTEDHDQNVKALKWVLANWDEEENKTNKKYEDREFDEHIRGLIIMALEMEEEYQKEKRRFREGLKEIVS